MLNQLSLTGKDEKLTFEDSPEIMWQPIRLKTWNSISRSICLASYFLPLINSWIEIKRQNSSPSHRNCQKGICSPLLVPHYLLVFWECESYMFQYNLGATYTFTISCTIFFYAVETIHISYWKKYNLRNCFLSVGKLPVQHCFIGTLVSQNDPIGNCLWIG